MFWLEWLNLNKKKYNNEKKDIAVFSHVKVASKKSKIDKELISHFDKDLVYVVAEIDAKQKIRIYGSNIFVPKSCFDIVDDFKIKNGDVVICVETEPEHPEMIIGKKTPSFQQ